MVKYQTKSSRNPVSAFICAGTVGRLDNLITSVCVGHLRLFKRSVFSIWSFQLSFWRFYRHFLVYTAGHRLQLKTGWIRNLYYERRRPRYKTYKTKSEFHVNHTNPRRKKYIYFSNHLYCFQSKARWSYKGDKDIYFIMCSIAEITELKREDIEWQGVDDGLITVICTFPLPPPHPLFINTVKGATSREIL